MRRCPARNRALTAACTRPAHDYALAVTSSTRIFSSSIAAAA